MRGTYHYGFKTREQAESALESAFASGEISEASRPKVEPYHTKAANGATVLRYAITLEER